jgi:AraC-like DNA-binding protein
VRHAAAIQAATTDSLPIADRFPYWADVVAQTFVPLECDTPARRDFSGNIRHRRIGRIGITDVRASAQRARRTRAKIAQAPSDDMIVVIHVEGVCNVGQRSDVATLRPGEGALVSAEQNYFFDFPDRFRQLVLKVPHASLYGKMLGRRAFRLAGGPANFLRHLAFAALDEPDTLNAAQEIGIERAIGELLRSAVTMPSGATVHEPPEATRYSLAQDFIRQNLEDAALNPAAVAAQLGLSPRSLARIFAHHGMTVDRSIWAGRLAGAKQDLADLRLTERSITDIAFAWGFNDAAHFSRSFSNAFGMTPTRFRAFACRVRR